MCTVTWLYHEDGYLLLCNRDEKRTRLQAMAPSIQLRDGVRLIAPTDGDAGGAWIGTNEFGVSVCLLNGPVVQENRSFRSRGLLLPELLTAASSEEVIERAWRLDLSPFAPFTLAVLEPRRQTTVIAWDGLDKSVFPYGDPHMPLVSSSFDPEGVKLARREEFQRRLDRAGMSDAATLLSFHASHGTGRPDAYSPCMHRPDAETVSFTQVRVTGSAVDFLYKASAPCTPSRFEYCTLPLIQ